MTILTDEIVEKGARAAYADMCEAFLRKQMLVPRSPREWEELREEERGHWRSRARAALQAVLPDVVEACAKAAEAEDPYDYGDFPEAAAARIRSLLNKEGNANG